MIPLDRFGASGTRADNQDTLGVFEYYSTGALSFVASVLCLVAFYHTLVSLTEPLHVLSTTVIVVVFLSLWAAIWFVLEIAWGWRNGRLTTS